MNVGILLRTSPLGALSNKFEVKSLDAEQISDKDALLDMPKIRALKNISKKSLD